MGDQTPEIPYSGGPYLLVAIPGHLDEVFPLNCTNILAEWEELLDPVALVASVAPPLFEPGIDWIVKDRFVIPTYRTGVLARRAARDERLIALFEASEAYLWIESAEVRTKPKKITELFEGENRSAIVQPLILGLAAYAAMSAIAGYAGRWLWSRYRQALREARHSMTEREVELFRRQLDERLSGDANADDDDDPAAIEKRPGGEPNA